MPSWYPPTSRLRSLFQISSASPSWHCPVSCCSCLRVWFESDFVLWRFLLCFLAAPARVLGCGGRAEMGFFSAVLGFFGFGVGLTLGLGIGYYLFIYFQPTDVKVRSASLPWFFFLCDLGVSSPLRGVACRMFRRMAATERGIVMISGVGFQIVKCWACLEHIV